VENILVQGAGRKGKGVKKEEIHHSVIVQGYRKGLIIRSCFKYFLDI
jgi:hypothetical protein